MDDVAEHSLSLTVGPIVRMAANQVSQHHLDSPEADPQVHPPEPRLCEAVPKVVFVKHVKTVQQNEKGGALAVRTGVR